MFFRRHVPPLPLSDLLESFWPYKDRAAPTRLERILPARELSMVVAFRRWLTAFVHNTAPL